jgi:Tol biopolymer transport system component
MSLAFDWEFEEEPADASPGDPTPPTRPRRRWLRWTIALLVLLTAIGLGVRAWYRHRMQVVSQAEDQLRALIHLELDALAAGDAELFRARQDPYNSRWRDRQLDRYFAPDRRPFAPAPGLIPAPNEPHVAEIHLTGRQARVELTRWFQPGDQGQPHGEPHPFHLTWFYRQRPDGIWYHVAPPDAYWDQSHVWHKVRLEVRATKAEATALAPVVPRLEDTIAQSCRWLDCPDGVHYVLRFEEVPAPWITTYRWTRTSSYRWTLPALYLTGLPADDGARRAWSHALRRWTVEALARTLVGDPERTDRLLYRHLVTRLQAQLGLAEPVAPDPDLITQAVRQGRLHTPGELWEATYDPAQPEASRLQEAQVAALAEFMEQELGLDALFSLLPALRHDYYPRDAALFADGRLDRTHFGFAWPAYLSRLTGRLVLPQSGALDSAIPPTARDSVPLTTWDNAPSTTWDSVPSTDRDNAPSTDRDNAPSTDRDNAPSTTWDNATPTPAPVAATFIPRDYPLAFNCEGRLWLAGVDPDQPLLLPLTNDDRDFQGLKWSPDGRWLLAMQVSAESGAPDRLYLLAADGSTRRPLLSPSQPQPYLWSVRWRPDGRQIAYLSRDEQTGPQSPLEPWLLDLETGVRRSLPGLPVWSPDGTYLAYTAPASTTTGAAVWLAGAEGKDPLQIAANATISRWGGAWSPDSSQIALTLLQDRPQDDTLALYDLPTGRLRPLLTLTDLRGRLPSLLQAAPPSPLTPQDPHRADPARLAEHPLQTFRPAGWSPDGRRLLVWAQGTDARTLTQLPTALVAVPVGGPERAPALSAQLVAYDYGRALVNLTWSPTSASRLTFTWWQQENQLAGPNTFLADLDAGLLYSTTVNSYAVGPVAAWSPGGDWIAFAGPDTISILDRDGREHVQYAPHQHVARPRHDCQAVVWNPRADLDPRVEP